ncbi:MAG: hypothetical protein J3K34DRAFT_496148 [Monoraphidium minutum]|nr:MAG: hypothetical protein J3K34DRAFT_496148 [Monoraphidium minutum]
MRQIVDRRPAALGAAARRSSANMDTSRASLRRHEPASAVAGLRRRAFAAAAARAAASAPAAGAAPADLWKLLTSRAYMPEQYVGPVDVRWIPGKGLGLVAARGVALGEPLLVCRRPLAALLGEPGQPPSNEELVDCVMAADLEPAQAAWLRLLHRGAGGRAERPAAGAEGGGGGGGAGEGGEGATGAASGGGEGEGADVLEARALLFGTWPAAAPRADGGGSSDGSSGGGGGGGAAAGARLPAGLEISGVRCPLTHDQAAELVSQVAYAEDCEDSAAAALRELQPESVAGEFALLNHSCAPNTCAAPFGTTLVVRAAAPVAAGEELTTCYLGEGRLAPTRTRRAALRAGYGFHCACARCLEEQRAFPTNWYPQDAPLLGLQSDGNGGGGGKGGGEGGSGGGGGALAGAWRWAQDWFGFGPAAAARPAPSGDNFLLVELFEAASTGGALASEVQAAAAAPGARAAAPRRAAAAAKAAASRARLSRALDALPRPPAPAARRWLAASAFPSLMLEADALDLFLSGGALPSPSDLTRADAAAAGRAERGGAAGWLSGLLRRGGGGGDAAAAAAPEEDDERTEAAARRALRARQLAALSAAADALDGVARGSELHLQTAVAAWDAARALRGAGAPEVRAAELAASKAHAARYGRLGAPLLSAAVAARRRQLLAASLSRRMSMLAWDGAEQGQG